MPGIGRRLELLNRLDPAAGGAFLAAALPRANAAERTALAVAAIRNGAPAAIAAVIRDLHQLGPAAREAIAAASVGCAAGVACLLEARGLRTRQIAANVIHLAELRSDPAILEFIVPMLTSERPDIARRAADAVLGVTIAVVGPCGCRRRSIATARQLDRALAQAADTYRRHRSDAVLLSLAVVANRPLRHVDAVLAQRDHGASMALRGLAGKLDQPLVRRNLLRWLANDALRSGAQRWLHALDGTEQVADALTDGHLLLAPARRRALLRVGRPLAVCPVPDVAARMPARSQRHLPALLARLDMSSAMRRTRLAELTALPAPVARLQVVHHLSSFRASRTRDALLRLCDDPEPVVAHRAAQALAAAGPVDEPVLERLAASTHTGVARRAARTLAGRRLDAFFDRWTQLPETARQAAARRLLVRDPDGLVQRLRTVLSTGSPDARLAGLLLARRLRIIDGVLEEVVQLTVEPGARLASSAVSALAEEPRCTEDLTRALEHPSPRVQANAIESLARVRAPRLDVLVEPWIGSGHNRPRANAIKALIQDGSDHALRELRRMLFDPRPLHRLSAIWVARTGRVAGAAGAVRGIGEADPSPEVRTRARAATRFLTLTAAATD